MTETYGAKQVASRIGAPAKTFRKFLRSPSSPYEAVGQGARYEIPKDDLERVRNLYQAWQANKRVSTPKPKAAEE